MDLPFLELSVEGEGGIKRELQNTTQFHMSYSTFDSLAITTILMPMSESMIITGTVVILLFLL